MSAGQDYCRSTARTDVRQTYNGGNAVEEPRIPKWEPVRERDEQRGWSISSAGSLFSFGSVLSAFSAFSIASIASAGSILSIGSAGSILSIGSAGSVLGLGGRRRPKS